MREAPRERLLKIVHQCCYEVPSLLAADALPATRIVLKLGLLQGRSLGINGPRMCARRSFRRLWSKPGTPVSGLGVDMLHMLHGVQIKCPGWTKRGGHLHDVLRKETRGSERDFDADAAGPKSRTQQLKSSLSIGFTFTSR